jgi:hypothetical protein
MALSLRSSETASAPDFARAMPLMLADRMSTPPPSAESSKGWT